MVSTHSKTKNKTDLEVMFPFKGNLRCGECNKSITAERKRRITCDCKYRFSALKTDVCIKCDIPLSEMKNPNEDIRMYYHCASVTARTECSQGSVTDLKVEESIAEILENLTLPKELIKAGLDTLDFINNKEGENKKELSHTIKLNIKKVDKKLGDLLDLRVDGEIGPEAYKTKKNALENDKEELKQSYGELKSSSTKKKAKYYFDFAQCASKIFLKADNSQKRKIFNALSSNQFLTDKNVTIATDSVFLDIQELAQVYGGSKDSVRTSIKPYIATKKAPFQVPNSSMLHR